MHIHLVTYATRRFRPRQLLLGWSARANRVADTVTHWTPEKLLSAGFEQRCENIRLSERGSGYWAWKPFIIDAKLREVPDGDIVFYCDVGRLYPFKLLDQPVSPYLKWMEAEGQDVMPGIEIPWDGPNSAWIKREVWIATGMDQPQYHQTAPVQASFSLWRNGASARKLAGQWLDACSRRAWVSDDPSHGGLAELPGFRAHRHDQALLSIICMAEKIHAIHIGDTKPFFDSRHPSQVSRHRFGETPGYPTLQGSLLRSAAGFFGTLEQTVRKHVRFGKPIHE